MPGDAGVSSSRSSALPGAALGLDGDAFKATGVKNLSVLLLWIATAEFLTVAATACATSLSYGYLVLQSWPAAVTYVSAALFIASLVLLVSLTFRHYVALQTQPLHRFLWKSLCDARFGGVQELLGREHESEAAVALLGEPGVRLLGDMGG